MDYVLETTLCKKHFTELVDKIGYGNILKYKQLDITNKLQCNFNRCISSMHADYYIRALIRPEKTTPS